MTTPSPENEVAPPTEPVGENPVTSPEGEAIPVAEPGAESSEETIQLEAVEAETRRRRLLLILLVLLLLLCCCASYFIYRYATKPEPLPEMLPVVDVNYPPTYKFSIALDKPVGVAVSPDGQRIYGVESEKERLIKMFDQDGNLLKSFAPPFTTSANRKPIYVAVDSKGRVFVSDTYNNVIAVFDKDGNFLDGIISRDKTLSDVVVEHLGSKMPAGTLFYYDNANKGVVYQLPGKETEFIPHVEQVDWSPLGLRFDQQGNLLVTNIVAGKHSVLIFPAADLQGSWVDFNPQVQEFGEEGKENDQLSFPNSAVTDSRGNYYVSDGNNGRISVWTPDLKYKTFFGLGSSDSSLNLPRGIWMDDQDRLHVVDAVGQYVRVYDVSGEEATFLYNFGVYGTAEGEFNFPNDIGIDGTGRLYIADRENNRIQVWSY
jgi:sugar lactone lactonase YvrE